MSQTPTCPRCGAPLPQDAPAGLCPKCLLKAGFESGGPSQPDLTGTAASPPSSRFEPPAVEELAKRFPQLEILELLGKGGMGAVYKARQRGLDRLVAVKILPPEVGADAAFAERFMREARALAQLSHSNIVGVHDFGQTDGLYYFIMEYVDGLNLRQAILAGNMSPKEALAIVPQICDALQFAHDEGIVHRDIKPENILIDKRGRVKIADFGLAKLLGQEPSDHRLTATHQVMGTLRYMAPEQLEGSHEVDHRADIYSLGVVFYELLTGELPMGRFAPPSKKVQIDVRLDEVVLRALEKEPEQRYQHASELRTSVDQISGTSAGTVVGAPLRRKTDLPPTAPDARLSRCALAGAIWAPFVLGLLMAMALYFTHRTSVATLQPAASEPIQGLAWAQILMACVAILFSLVGVAAPFGTTILGVVAIGQIRRSNGKLYGLPLAVFDALVFPLLLLDFLIVTFISAVIIFTLAAFGLLATMSPAISDGPLALLLGLPLAAWVDYRIVQAAWWKATGYEPPPKPTVAVNVPPAAAPQPAAPAVEGQGRTLRVKLGVPLFAKSAALAALAWLLMALLWNAREIGLLISAFALGGVVVFTAELVNRIVQTATGCQPLRSPQMRWMNAVAGVLLSAAGVYLLFLGTYQAWDRMQWNTAVPSSDEFRREYQGAEHRLLQRLDRFKNDTPRAELLVHTWSLQPNGWNMTCDAPPSIDLFTGPFIGLSLAIGAFLIFCAYLRLLQDWLGRPSVALAMTICVLLSGALCFEVLSFMLPISSGKMGTMTTTSVTTEQDARSILARLDAWATTHQFVRDNDFSWYVKRLPQQDTLAQVELCHLWRPSVFDRWHMTWAGVQRAAPDIALQIISDADGKQTVIQLNARIGSGDDPAAKAVQSQFDSLAAALKNKMPLPGAKAFEMTTAGEGATSEHLKLGGVFFDVTPDQPGAAWATVQAFDQPAQPAFLLLVRHKKQFNEGSSFPQKVWTKADEGSIQQTLHVDGRIVEVKYAVKLNLDQKTIKSEYLTVENKNVATPWISTDASTRSMQLTFDGRPNQAAPRLITIDLTTIPEQIDFFKMELPAELVEIKTAEQLHARTPEILELLKKDPQAGKFLVSIEPPAKAAPTSATKEPPEASKVSPQQARFYALGKLSREAFGRGDSADAAKLAEEYLALAAKFPKDWNYGNAIHDANEILGLVALENGEVAKAKAYLLAAGKSTGSPQLDSFGPNLELAAALLARGEKQAVLEYLVEVGKFWTMGKERLARFKKTIEAGETPRELKQAADLSPLVGSWLAEDALDPRGLLKMVLEFSADGSAVQSMLSRTTSKYRVVEGRLRIVNPDSGKEEDPALLEFHEGNLVVNFGKESPFPQREVKLTHVADDEKSGILAGTWSGKVHLEDVGDAELSCTFDSNESGTMTQIMRMPADLRFTYTWKGDKLKYTLNGRPSEARCQVSNDEFTLTGFQSHTDGKPHLFRRWSPPGAASSSKPADAAPK